MTFTTRPQKTVMIGDLDAPQLRIVFYRIIVNHDTHYTHESSRVLFLCSDWKATPRSLLGGLASGTAHRTPRVHPEFALGLEDTSPSSPRWSPRPSAAPLQVPAPTSIALPGGRTSGVEVTLTRHTSRWGVLGGAPRWYGAVRCNDTPRCLTRRGLGFC